MRIFSTVLALCLLTATDLSAQTLDRIKETGEIRFGYRTDAEPLSYQSENRPQGYTPKVCFAMAPLIGAQLGMDDMDIVFTPVTTEDRFDQVASGTIDVLCGAASVTLTRREKVDFSIPVFVDGTTVALRADGPESLQGLAGEKVGVRSGTTTLEALTNSLSAEGIDAEVIQFDDHPSGIAALEGGVITAYFADQSIIMSMVMSNENAADFKVFDQILTIEKHGLALPRGDSDFRLAVDRALSQLYQDGSMQQAFEESIPAADPGLAIRAMFLLAPTLP
ncbi:MAG: amino acid ABC transporter substrate-binding protein [Pseudomonadota bacterium]